MPSSVKARLIIIVLAGSAASLAVAKLGGPRVRRLPFTRAGLVETRRLSGLPVAPWK
jgi:hypothetical protein